MDRVYLNGKYVTSLDLTINRDRQAHRSLALINRLSQVSETLSDNIDSLELGGEEEILETHIQFIDLRDDLEKNWREVFKDLLGR